MCLCLLSAHLQCVYMFVCESVFAENVFACVCIFEKYTFAECVTMCI